jgi:hypothetical protein
MCSTNDTHVSGCCTGNMRESDICCDNAYASSFALASGVVVTSLGDTPSAWESFLRSSAKTTSVPTSSGKLLFNLQVFHATDV